MISQTNSICSTGRLNPPTVSLFQKYVFYIRSLLSIAKDTLAQNGYVCRLIRYEITSKLKTHKHSVLRNHLDVPLRYIDHSQSWRAVSRQNSIIYLPEEQENVCILS